MGDPRPTSVAGSFMAPVFDKIKSTIENATTRIMGLVQAQTTLSHTAFNKTEAQIMCLLQDVKQIKQQVDRLSLSIQYLNDQVRQLLNEQSASKSMTVPCKTPFIFGSMSNGSNPFAESVKNAQGGSLTEAADGASITKQSEEILALVIDLLKRATDGEEAKNREYLINFSTKKYGHLTEL